MKGLYVYGALLMAMCIAIGIVKDAPGVIAVSLVSAGLAAFSEATVEILRETASPARWMIYTANLTAIASWIATAVAAISAFLVI